jgi:hypothetical protein
MTSQSPRIYIYKITFEEVPYYYYGVHKERKYDEYYMGSPTTNKWCWDFYAPKKQILEFFDYNDQGYIEAQKIEKRIIKLFLNDKWCLNEGIGGFFSLKICRKNGKKAGNYSKNNKVGIFSLTTKELSQNGKKGGSIGGKKGAKTQINNKIGIYGLTKEETLENCRKGGKVIGEKLKKERKGIFGLSEKEKLNNCIEGGKKTGSQKWICLETGYITNAGGLTRYQKSKGIDPSKRKRIQ